MPPDVIARLPKNASKELSCLAARIRRTPSAPVVGSSSRMPPLCLQRAPTSVLRWASRHFTTPSLANRVRDSVDNRCGSGCFPDRSPIPVSLRVWLVNGPLLVLRFHKAQGGGACPPLPQFILARLFRSIACLDPCLRRAQGWPPCAHAFDQVIPVQNLHGSAKYCSATRHNQCEPSAMKAQQRRVGVTNRACHQQQHPRHFIHRQESRLGFAVPAACPRRPLRHHRGDARISLPFSFGVHRRPVRKNTGFGRGLHTFRQRRFAFLDTPTQLVLLLQNVLARCLRSCHARFLRHMLTR